MELPLLHFRNIWFLGRTGFLGLRFSISHHTPMSGLITPTLNTFAFTDQQGRAAHYLFAVMIEPLSISLLIIKLLAYLEMA